MYEVIVNISYTIYGHDSPELPQSAQCLFPGTDNTFLAAFGSSSSVLSTEAPDFFLR